MSVGQSIWDKLFRLVLALLVIAAVLAAFVPATRAASIEPVQALRNE